MSIQQLRYSGVGAAIEYAITALKVMIGLLKVAKVFSRTNYFNFISLINT